MDKHVRTRRIKSSFLGTCPGLDHSPRVDCNLRTTSILHCHSLARNRHSQPRKFRLRQVAWHPHGMGGIGDSSLHQHLCSKGAAHGRSRRRYHSRLLLHCLRRYAVRAGSSKLLGIRLCNKHFRPLWMAESNCPMVHWSAICGLPNRRI